MKPTPKRPPSSPYITADGFAALAREEKDIWKKRGEVTRALSAAAAEGDRSENAEYIYRKKQLGEIDRRIRYLQKRLPTLNIVDKVGDRSKIFFGAWVTVANEAGDETEYRIVGGDEIESDSSKGYISVDSPMARGLLGKGVGDEVWVEVAGERRGVVVRGVRYE